MSETDLTPEEKKAIRALKRVAKTWPDTLWLFSANGTLCVMKKEAGEGHHLLPNGGVDPDYCVESIDIDNSGGDW